MQQDSIRGVPCQNYLTQRPGSNQQGVCNRAVWIRDRVLRMVGDFAEVVAACEQYIADRQ